MLPRRNLDTSLGDPELAKLDDQARAFFRRVLELVNDTGCSTELAYQAVEAAEQEHHE